MSDPILSVRDVAKGYRIGPREVPVLRNVCLDVRGGDFVALQGSSGAGKSTLLHLLGALDVPDRGSIRFEGTELSSAPAATLAEVRSRRVGFVFQAYHLLPELEAVENVMLPARIARRSGPDVRQRAVELLDRVGLGDRIDHRPYELSGGEQQRVAIARALMNTPVLLLADEPTGNLDSRTGRGIIELLIRIQSEFRMTLIMATHDAQIAALAPRVCELRDGALAGPGEPCGEAGG